MRGSVLRLTCAVLFGFGLMASSNVFAYNCPGASTCAGKACPPGNPACGLSQPAQCNCS